MDDKLVVTVSDAVKLLSISRPTLYRYIKKDPTFPKAIHLTEKKVVFRVEALKSGLLVRKAFLVFKNKLKNGSKPYMQM